MACGYSFKTCTWELLKGWWQWQKKSKICIFFFWSFCLECTIAIKGMKEGEKNVIYWIDIKKYFMKNLTTVFILIFRLVKSEGWLLTCVKFSLQVLLFFSIYLSFFPRVYIFFYFRPGPISAYDFFFNSGQARSGRTYFFTSGRTGPGLGLKFSARSDL